MVPEGGRQADMWKLQGCALLLARGELLSREPSGNSVGGLSSVNTNQLSSPTPSQCQRSHWKTHRAGCKAKRVAARFVDSILYLVVAHGYAANVLPALRLCRDTWKDERIWRVIVNTPYTYICSSLKEKPRPCTETRLIRECRRLCPEYCLPPHPSKHGHVEGVVSRLLGYGADPNIGGGALCEGWEGKTRKYSYNENTQALILAAEAGRGSVCRILLEGGAFPSIPLTDTTFPRLKTAMCVAAGNGDLHLLKVGISHTQGSPLLRLPSPTPLPLLFSTASA